VVVCAAYRLEPRGRDLQAELARLIRAGVPREAWASVMTAMLPRPLRDPVHLLSRLAASPMIPADPTDLLVTLDAEDAFNVEAELPRVTAPTLVIAGGKDHFHTQELFQAPPRASRTDGCITSLAGDTCGRPPHPWLHACGHTHPARALSPGQHWLPSSGTLMGRVDPDAFRDALRDRSGLIPIDAGSLRRQPGT
jgi:pimeloyl-ACP methyl ester carboxylesterase